MITYNNKSTRPVVSIVISFYNAQRTLGKTLLSLFRQNFPKNEYEIILVNDGSMDNSVEEIKKKSANSPVSIKIIQQRHRGCYSARNIGIKASSGEYIAFIDSDMVAHPDWLKELMNKFKQDKDGRLGGICGKVVNVQGPFLKEGIRYLTFMSGSSATGADPHGAKVGTGNVCYRKSVLERLGGFDERFDPKFRGDSDLGMRCVEAGFRVVFCENAIDYHFAKSIKISKLPKEYFKYHKDVLLYAKHGKKASLITFPFTRSVVGPFSTLGLVLITVAIIAVFFPPILFIALMSSFLFYVMYGYNWRQSRGPHRKRVPLSLRFKEALFYQTIYITIYASRIYGSIKYRKLLF